MSKKVFDNLVLILDFLGILWAHVVVGLFKLALIVTPLVAVLWVVYNYAAVAWVLGLFLLGAISAVLLSEEQ